MFPALILLAGLAFPPPPRIDTSNFGAGVQRTMTLLATSTPEHRNQVRILFYGQSITKQEWWKDVADDLRQRFPNADIVFSNRAIGGFAAPVLIRPAPLDVYPFYPDLVIFHVYGDEANYESIIAGIRRNTTAEVALQTDHVTWVPPRTGAPNPGQLKTKEFHDKHSTEWLRDLARRYECELIEVRQPWYRYLEENNLEPKDLLRDGVHLNAQGNYLLAELTKMHLRYDPKFASPNLVTTLQVGKDVQWKDGRITIEFTGNRVDLLTSTRPTQNYTRAVIRIDGKKPSEFPELYAFTRPSDCVGVDWPAFISVSSEKPLLAEDWTMKVLDGDAGKFRFSVAGSKTGPDGEGVSTAKFVSKSGRIVIEPGDWYTARSFRYSKRPMPVAFEARWKVLPLFTDVYEPPRTDDVTREYIATLAQGLPNGPHRLDIISTTVIEPEIDSIRIYRPPSLPVVEAKP